MTEAKRLLRYRAWSRLPRPVRRWLVRRATPSYTLGAIAVIEQDGAVLLVRLAYRSAWGLPGGLLARGEHPEEAVVREVAEEVCLDVEPVHPPTVVVTPHVRRCDVVYRCRIVGPAAAANGGRPEVVPCSPELLEARWFDLDGLPPLHEEASGALRVLGHRVPRGSG